MRQIPLPIGEALAPSFDTFMTTPETVRALAYLRQPSATPVYLWGPTGSGKTHLLRALAARHQAAGEPVGWFDASVPQPWEYDEAWRLIVLDDCEQYTPEQQQAAFALFVQAYTDGTPVASAGRFPPVDLPLRDDLRTRLGWGHVFALAPLSESQSRAALRREADRRALFLSDEVMDYLLTRFSRDLKHLMNLLDRLDGYAWETKRGVVTIPMLKQMLADPEGAAP